MTTAGVIALILGADYLQWSLFVVGQDALTLIHEDFFVASFLIAFSFVFGILLGTLLLSFITLSMRQYVIFSYLFGVLSIFVFLPFLLHLSASSVEISFLGSLLLVTIIPLIGIIFAIATGQKRKENRKGMTYRERRREDDEDKRRRDFQRRAIFPWIRKRKRAI